MGFYRTKVFEGLDKGFAPFGLLGDGYGDTGDFGSGVQAIDAPFGSLG